MKYEYLKGSEKDFDGIGNEDVVRVYDTGQTKFYAVAEEISSIPSDWFIIAERRPITELVWSGEGLPPVGVECEGLFPRHLGNSFEWQDCLVLYVFEHECAVKSKVTSTLHYCDQFRPIRSPEDVARDEAIEAMICAARCIDHTTLRGLVEILYDAGYRKAEPSGN